MSGSGVRSGTGVVGDVAKRQLHRSISDLQGLVVASDASADQLSDMVVTLTTEELQRLQVRSFDSPPTQLLDRCCITLGGVVGAN